MPLPKPKGRLVLEGVTAAPPGQTLPTLRDINLALAKGEHLAIVGPSASGKSTLARVVLGIWPSQFGCVRLDGADITQWNRMALGPHIGYLPQDIELFDGTISENIARFEEVDPQAVVLAAQRAGVHDMILAQPNGYDTLLAHGGNALSAGQRQRIGLARALYGNPVLIVLDEPDANLDEAGEQSLASCLIHLRQIGTTVLVITHRSRLLHNVDKVLVLKEGQISSLKPPTRMAPVAKMTADGNRPVPPQRVAALKPSARGRNNSEDTQP